MGLVPWVLRGESTPAKATANAEVIANVQAVTGTETQAEASCLFPESQSALASCLSDYEVSVVPRRGSSASESALRGRVILLLESRHTAAVSVPIDGHVWDLVKHEEQLLMAMLRSIGLVENDLCRTVPATSGVAHEGAGRPATVAELHRQVPRLALLLLNRIDPLLTPEHHRLDGGAGVIGWRLPHPALLLASPERKRQAWEVLKAIRRTLSSS